MVPRRDLGGTPTSACSESIIFLRNRVPMQRDAQIARRPRRHPYVRRIKKRKKSV